LSENPIRSLLFLKRDHDGVRAGSRFRELGDGAATRRKITPPDAAQDGGARAASGGVICDASPRRLRVHEIVILRAPRVMVSFEE